jgi:hypothetical protein
VKRTAVVVAAMLVLASGAVALAAIPGANGVITGCRDTRTGALRVIDAEAGQTCTAKESALTWNQSGPQGPAGQDGVSGYEVVTRDVLIPSFSGPTVVAATCPAGKHAFGGSVAVQNGTEFTFPNGSWPNSVVAEVLSADKYSALVGSGASVQTAHVVVSCATTT